MRINVRHKQQDVEGYGYKLSVDNFQEIVDLISLHNEVISSDLQNGEMLVTLKIRYAPVPPMDIENIKINLDDWIYFSQDFVFVRPLKETKFFEDFETIS